MLLNFILTVFLALANDSIVYLNSQNQVAYVGSSKSEITLKELSKNIKQSTKLNGGIIARKSDGCWKMYASDGKIILDSCISNFKPIDNQKLAIEINFGWGLIDVRGKILSAFNHSEIKKTDGIILGRALNQIEIANSKLEIQKIFNYDAILFLDSSFFVSILDGRFGLVHFNSGRQIIQPVYEQITQLSDSLFSVRKAGKYGVFNRRGVVILPFEYDRIEPDTLGMLKLVTQKVSTLGNLKNIKVLDEKFGICNPQGKVIIPVNYEEIGTFTDGLYPVRKGELWGFINLKGEEVITYFYRKTQKYCFGVAPVSKGFYYGIIDKKGSWVMPPDFSDISIVNDSVWIWNRRDRAGFYFPKLRKMGVENYEEIKVLNGGWFRISEDGNYGVLSPELKLILKPTYSSIKVFPEEKIIVAGKVNYYSIYFLNGNLKVFMNYPFTKFNAYIDGMAMVVQNDRVGFIDKDGQLLVSTQYDEARPFSNGMAAIKLNSKWGFVDKNERIAASPNYAEVLDFVGNATAAKRNDKWAFIDKMGKEILKPQYDVVNFTLFNNFSVKIGNKWGMVDKNGVEAINPVYRDCQELNMGVFKVRSYNKYGLADINNKPLTPQKFDDIFYSSPVNKYIFITKGEWKGL